MSYFGHNSDTLNCSIISVKSRNLKGDKTLAIREILIDNDLDMTDRDLDYEIIEKTNLIKVSIS